MKCAGCGNPIHEYPKQIGLQKIHDNEKCRQLLIDKHIIKVRKEKAKKKKPKKKLPSWYRKKAIEEVKKLAKERDQYTCQHCGKTRQQGQIQGSHNISVGRAIWLACDIDNLLTLCAYCHLRFWHSSPIEAMEWFKETFPERCEYLLEAVKKQRKVNWEEEYNKLKALQK